MDVTKLFWVNPKKFRDLYRDTSSYEEFCGYLKSLNNFKVVEYFTESDFRKLYELSKN